VQTVLPTVHPYTAVSFSELQSTGHRTADFITVNYVYTGWRGAD